MSDKTFKTFAQVKAEEKANKERLMKVNCLLNNDSGIYILTRVDENGIKYAYIGQAVAVLNRLAQHLVGYKQHIDRSLKAHGLYDRYKNPFGWNVTSLYCRADKLNEMEREYIKKYASLGYQLRNQTIGGQDKGKYGIGENKAPKNYHDGLANGYLKCRKEIRELFDKYLDFQMKEPYINKSGKVDKIKQKKYDEFVEFLKISEEQR